MDNFGKDVLGQCPGDVFEAAMKVVAWTRNNDIPACLICGEKFVCAETVDLSDEAAELENTKAMLEATRKLLAARHEELALERKEKSYLQQRVRELDKLVATPRVVVRPGDYSREYVEDVIGRRVDKIRSQLEKLEAEFNG